MKIACGITGASGMPYAVRLIEFLAQTENEVYTVVSEWGKKIIKLEMNREWEEIISGFKGKVYNFEEDDLFSPLASGSFGIEKTVILPCSMKTLSAIAHGFSQNLIERMADVSIKEGKMLVLCPREMPFSSIHLENMLKLSKMGVKIAPPVPAFYPHPESIEDITDFVVGKILDILKIEHNLFRRWHGNPAY
ncbi:MAG: UbiX family flavin prenyltransferase [Deltaproteobacteria bacterium]|nr:UbiX family flavin prenyltransferase [Deltaproteobacteria bacterium]